MKCGCGVYLIKVPDSSVPADLAHLERALGGIGYTCLTSLKLLQDEITDVSVIRPSPAHASHIRNNMGTMQLVVDFEDPRLDAFAKGYTPIPLQS
jgi:hypothetical protein